ncbi:MAG: hypothetical protein IJQ99_05310 [Synergistaceae bacterium]|nr:hypothetical protein [Synergistaceae bacterium]MBQ6435547.1 hypothetical protein [Synergistaceae bacterium]MBR0080767.1 hypothetical protein [Synergistaceae bacterium]MBR0253810.1 hypothetical protein [Synergistaceae bacterium]MBR0316264.1 hypothetical protein [Synergistaceae bacterium]
MPEELDPITAQIVSELSASMLPSLSNSLKSVVHVDDVVNALDRTNMITQDLRNQIEKAVRSGIDESRAGRSMIIQSVRTVVEEISGLKKLLDKISFDTQNNNSNKPDENSINILQELARISELINELISGIATFSQTYARDHEKKESQTSTQNFETLNDSQILNENNSRLDKLINNSLPGLEGLVKAHEKTQSHELEEFSKEISTLHEQNNLALIHEIHENFNNELEKISDEILEKVNVERGEKYAKISLTMKIIIGISGLNFILILIIIFMMLFR